MSECLLINWQRRPMIWNGRAWFFVLGLLLASPPYSLAHPSGEGALASRRPKVVATLFPLYDFAREIAGDKIDLEMLIPPGVEPHAFEPRPRDMMRLNQADVFLYIGSTMEPWAADLLQGIPNKSLGVLDLSQNILGDEMSDDPHFWLDLSLAQKMVLAIAEVFAIHDEVNRDYYMLRALSYNERLKALDQRYIKGLADCESRNIVYAGHFAFGYLAQRYHLTHISPYKGFSPDAEPSPRNIKDMILTIRKTGCKVVYFEELINPKTARMIAEETGARLELLHAAHNVAKEDLAGASYIKIMEENLHKLQEGLQCRLSH